jgi:hypothetical protein
MPESKAKPDVTRNEIRAFLTCDDHFPQLAREPQFLADCVEIACHLASGPSGVGRGLATLEAAMYDRITGYLGQSWLDSVLRWKVARDARAYFDARGPQYKRYGEQVNTIAGSSPTPQAADAAIRELPKPPKDPRFAHVLSSVLADAEAAVGFTVNPTPTLASPARRVPTFVGALDERQFSQQLLNRNQWKDPGVVEGHGEFSHRIQWYLIAQGPRLTHRVPELFQRLVAHMAIAHPERRPDGVSGGIALWDALLDRGAAGDRTAYFKAVGNHDFRSPDMLNRYLMDEGNDYPLLASFLRGRHQKRAGGFVPVEYVAKKMFGRRFDVLSAEEAARVEAIAQENRGTKVLV